MLIWLLVLLIGFAGLLIFLQGGTSGIESLPALPTAITVIAALAIAYIFVSRPRSGETSPLRPYLLIALAVCALAGAVLFKISAYFKSPETNASAQADDGYFASGDAPRAVRLRKKDNGQFIARAEFNGEPIDVLIDTGASTVTLRYADAERAGIDTTSLSFSTPIETANGPSLAASVHIRSVAIGVIKIDNVEALVAKPGSLNESLLGITFLRRLRSYELNGEFLTLRK
jgi:aspartyl protease family protein